MLLPARLIRLPPVPRASPDCPARVSRLLRIQQKHKKFESRAIMDRPRRHGNDVGRIRTYEASRHVMPRGGQHGTSTPVRPAGPRAPVHRPRPRPASLPTPPASAPARPTAATLPPPHWGHTDVTDPARASHLFPNKNRGKDVQRRFRHAGGRLGPGQVEPSLRRRPRPALHCSPRGDVRSRASPVTIRRYSWLGCDDRVVCRRAMVPRRVRCVGTPRHRAGQDG